MGSTNYTNTDLTIIEMVRNRLQFLAPGNPVDDQLGMFILELMEELEPCFKVSQVDWNNTQEIIGETAPPWPMVPSPDKVGHEEFYTVTMMALIADLVAVNVLVWISANNANGDGSPAGNGTFLKRAKADVVEVEWAIAQGAATLSMDAGKLLEYYRSAAQRKAVRLGCSIEVCDPCAEATLLTTGPLPFIVVKDCGCH